MDIEIIIQECFLDDPLQKLLKRFLFSIDDRRQKSYEPFSLSLSLSLSHTHLHTHNLSYFPYITYNVRLNAIQNIRQ